MTRARWFFPLLAAVLSACGPAPGEAPNDPAQTSGAPEATVSAANDQLRTGRFSYMADAAMFEDCRTGKRFPVSMEGAYIELERAYLNSGIEPGKPILADIEGRYLERPSMEGNRNIVKLIVDTFVAFSDDKACAPSFNEPLRNTYWKLTETGGRTVFTHEGQREAHMILNEAENQVRGHGGCNRFSGGFELDGESLTFGPLAITEMACPRGMDTEAAFLAVLTETDRYRTRGQILELYKGEQLLAKFEAVHLP